MNNLKDHCNQPWHMQEVADTILNEIENLLEIESQEERKTYLATKDILLKNGHRLSLWGLFLDQHTDEIKAVRSILKYVFEHANNHNRDIVSIQKINSGYMKAYEGYFCIYTCETIGYRIYVMLPLLCDKEKDSLTAHIMYNPLYKDKLLEKLVGK